MSALNLHTAFLTSEHGETTLTRRTLGMLRTSGAIAAFDPLTTTDAACFATPVPRGLWPVEVLLGASRGDVRVLLARVRFSDAAPTRFELAWTEGQDVRALREDERFGYGVDAGVGCFAGDGRAAPEWVHQALLKNDDVSWSYAASEGLVAFSSGYGDGVYSSYFGYDDEESVVSLTTDFGVLDLELPKPHQDDAFRHARADELFEHMTSNLHRLGGPDDSDVRTSAMDLAALREGAAHLVPRFAEAITEAQRAHDPEDELSPASLALELFVSTLGKLLGNADADARFAAVMPRFDDALLARALAQRHQPSSERTETRGAEALVAALCARKETSQAVLLHTLALVSRHSRDAQTLSDLAERALREASADPTEPLAGALICGAVEPFCEEQCDAHGAWKVLAASDALIALSIASLDHFDDANVQRCIASMLIAQGRAALVLEYATRTERLAPLLALARSPSDFAAQALAKLHTLASDRTRSLEERWEAVASLTHPPTQCALLLELGLDGFEAASIQLGYLDASVEGDVLEALDALATRAPGKTLRKRAAETAQRLRKQKAKRAPSRM